ncbi:hypothetical protein C8R42DRAFT_663774 [Lentinula raphanica]|nr:hypothetical protein C8R42DRAFT_663774 [Lentinula raphanica]
MNIKLSSQTYIPQLRAYHTSEIPLVFGTYNTSANVTSIPSTSTGIALSKTMQRTWLAFAQDPQNALPSQGWPVYYPSGTIATLGNYQNLTGWLFTESEVIDALCSNVTFLEGIFDQVEGLLASL